ncbi:MAG: aminotransferase class I/II-fold pyridoxal phosphate-dependent enzyme [Gemmatimonadetes bacterium]|nr:aminotransferase class I/II-fold pyridoxal phosphate-dependent enzyme [Gemmatimonadota bacterium]MYD13310.1 aminotransferase class I/II-fold pyridoxal phosphate-dependent enzyme [Gemmatimonadota bacterium]MYE70455.1 aminotransferase class I/II-fold pyridoxal phosphate-dependent enzyme [Gemmatimonadota bacterium]MYJ67240.1 aminotransferase class I/II-fold pyridoxal phosphate-dependent enzyme [Gemmatimonadota bacterium]
MSQRTATRTHTFTESVIRDMTRVARQYDAINLAQGFPDFPAPQLLKDAACRAIQEDVNQYAITWGTPSLRSALARKYREWYGLAVHPDSEITVTCGATEAMAVVMLAVVDPGEEVIVLEPFYENYGPDAILCDASPIFLPLLPPDFRLDPARLRSAVTPRTRAIVINTPNNPTGRVFDPNEMAAVAELCIEHDLLAITDEIYEHIVFTGRHIPLAGMPGMRERTIVISGLSKTFSVTGWRVGTIVAPPVLTGAMRKVHDFLTVGAPAPLQEACAAGLDSLGRDYYEGIARDYRKRRDILWRGLRDSGFGCTLPEGAYYIMADFSALSELDDMAFSTYMARECGVAPVPGSSFYSRPERGAKLVRFAFCKQAGTLERAVERLRSFFGNP